MEAASDDMESRNSYSAIGSEKWLKKKKKNFGKQFGSVLKSKYHPNPTTMILGT